MFGMMTVVVILTMGAMAWACAVLALAMRARNARRLALGGHGAALAAGDGPGISVLCSGVRQSGQVENLLSTELVRYEVVAVVDAAHYPACFERLVDRYRMIRVEHVPSDEFPARGVRSMWRSRKRCYRRLVLLDREETTQEEDFDAAASVATYDWLLPVHGAERLIPGAVERLAEVLGGAEPGTIGAVRSWPGEAEVLLNRDAVSAAGGFGQRAGRKIPRSRRRTLWEPVLYERRFAAAGKKRELGLAACLLAAGVVAAAVMQRWGMVVLLLGAAVLQCAWVLTRLAATDGTAVELRGAKIWRGKGRKFGVKNFTLS
ncbi:hypothetical protein [uncultured Alistipes sp.]|jgi:hypothetical protein|uniref:hypothetical protein n=1 Tax=uncultured Alistipes sp. TaxID=538949 RepID=UPI0025D58AD4|nr:hypothetical protein [uncultured Alistipes sp.]